MLGGKIVTPTQSNHAEGVYGIKANPCMESSRSDVCNQSEGENTLTRDAIRLTAITCTLRVIPCQSFGLDRKKTVRKRSFFLAPQAGFEPVYCHIFPNTY